MADSSIVDIKPLYIELLDKKSKLVGKTTVYSRMNLYKYRARIYKCPNDIDGVSELYKVVIKRRYVVGYCMVFVDRDNYLDVPLFASLDSRYKMGKILSQIAADRMFDLNCRGIKLIASWNSLLHHYRSGLQPHTQKEIDGALCDQVIASGTKREIQNLGSIVMYLPEEVIEDKLKKASPILNTDKLECRKGGVGSVKVWNNRKKREENLSVVKEVYASGIENYSLVFKRKKIASVTLNYFRKKVCDNGRNIYQNCLNDYPAWSVFALYGKNKSRPDKTFAEYWSIRKTKEFLYDRLLEILFQIALEAGAYKGCPLLQIEADWDEHKLVYDYGFRTQDYPFERSSEEIVKLIEKEAAKLKRNRGALNLNKLGSVEMSMEKERAVSLGYQNSRVLNCGGGFDFCFDRVRSFFRSLWRRKN